MKTKRAFIWGVFLSLTISALFIAHQRFGLLTAYAAEKNAARSAPNIMLETNALPKDTRGITSFAPVVKRVAPSVVTIYSSKMVRRSFGMSPFDDPLFRRFFGGRTKKSRTLPRPRRGRAIVADAARLNSASRRSRALARASSSARMV